METRLTNAWLQRQFNHFNSVYFGGRIHPSVNVVFGNTQKEGSNGLYNYATRTITIDDQQRKLGNARHIKTDLLHEMVHADLDINDGYVGDQMEKDSSHGARFQGEICRLWRIGAYDGLL
jgi:hypothetical protein